MLGTVVLWLAVRLVLARGHGGRPATMPCSDSPAASRGGRVPSWSTRCWPRRLRGAERAAARHRKGAVLSLPAFFLGAAPFFYFYAVDPYSSVRTWAAATRCARFPTGLSLLVRRAPAAVPRLGPVPRRRSRHARAGRSSTAGPLAFFLWHLRGSFRARHPLRDAAIFPIFFLVFALLFAASIHIRRNAPHVCDPALRLLSGGRWRSGSGARGAPGSSRRGSGCAALFLLHGWTTHVLGGQPCASGRSVHAGLLTPDSRSRGQGGEAPLSADHARVGDFSTSTRESTSSRHR